MDSDSVASWELGDYEIFIRDMRRVRRNDPRIKGLCCDDDIDIVQNMTAGEWEDIGRDISNNIYLEWLAIIGGVLNDEKLSSLFRGFTRSSSIIKLDLGPNEFSAAGLRSLEPFLQNSTNLRELDVGYNSIQTEGFNILMRALRGSPIESLYCNSCGITSIEIENVPNNLQSLFLINNDIQSEGFNRLIRSLRDSSIEDLRCNDCNIQSIDIDIDSFPRKLKALYLGSNRIDSNGCNEIAKLLRERDTKLQKLLLDNNLIGDEGVAILADALKTNTSLKELGLWDKDSISDIGRIMMLELVNDISSIKATLQSNHILQSIWLGGMNDYIRHYTDMATKCNRDYPVTAGREKVIRTQLHSQTRAKLAGIQGVQHSLYSEIDPLHLPEVLSLVGNRHGQKELYVALKASIAEVMSTVNRKRCIQQRIADHESIIAKHSAMRKELIEELAAMEEDSPALVEQRSIRDDGNKIETYLP